MRLNDGILENGKESDEGSGPSSTWLKASTEFESRTDVSMHYTEGVRHVSSSEVWTRASCFNATASVSMPGGRPATSSSATVSTTSSTGGNSQSTTSASTSQVAPFFDDSHHSDLDRCSASGRA